MSRTTLAALAFAALALPAAASGAGSLATVPCRDMGWGRIVIDAQFLPPGINPKAVQFKIVKSAPTAAQEEYTRIGQENPEWATLVCTIRILQG